MRAVLILGFLLFCLVGSTQEVFSTAGDYVETTAGSASWTIGETISQTLESDSQAGYLTQGFHQPLPVAEPIPTMGEWGLMVCCLMLMILGIVVIRNTFKDVSQPIDLKMHLSKNIQN